MIRCPSVGELQYGRQQSLRQFQKYRQALRAAMIEGKLNELLTSSESMGFIANKETLDMLQGPIMHPTPSNDEAGFDLAAKVA